MFNLFRCMMPQIFRLTAACPGIFVSVFFLYYHIGPLFETRKSFSGLFAGFVRSNNDVPGFIRFFQYFNFLLVFVEIYVKIKNVAY
jgi:hypothetical protein